MSIKDFFGSMNSTRWTIVVGTLGVIGLAINGWRLYSQRAELDEALLPSGLVEKTANHAMQLGKECSRLQADADREGLSGGQTEPSAYFRGLATDPKVNLGSVDIDAGTPQIYYKGTKDLKFTLKPQEDKGFARDKIMNYMYLLEQKSRRVRVTQIQLSPAQKLREHEIGNDLWKWRIELTSRVKDEKKEAK